MSGLVRSTPLLLSGAPVPIERRASTAHGNRIVRIRSRQSFNARKADEAADDES